MLVTEPIVLLVSLYMGLKYALTHSLLCAHPHVYEKVYEMKPGAAQLPLIGLVIGMVLGLCFIEVQQYRAGRNVTVDGQKLKLELLLLVPMVGAPLFAGVLFW
jgi:MFS transporter, DHA1 family, multidrug resistance protein